MSLRDEINSYRKKILLGEKPSTKTAGEQQPEPEPEKSKLRELLDARKVKEAPPEEPTKPEPAKEQSPESAMEGREPAKEPEPAAQPEPEKEPDVVTITGEDYKLFKAMLVEYQAKNKPVEPEGTPTPEGTQEPAKKSETQEPEPEAAPIIQLDENDPLVMGRRALDRRNTATPPVIGELLQKECERLKVPSGNRELLLTAIISKRGEELTADNVREITEQTIKDFPIISRSTQIPSVSGSKSADVVQDYSGMSLAERSQALKNMS